MSNPIFLFDISAEYVDAALEQAFQYVQENKLIAEESFKELKTQLHRHADLGPDQTHVNVAPASDFITLIKKPKTRKKLLELSTAEEFQNLLKKVLHQQVHMEHHIPEELHTLQTI